ncbi:MAG: endonuclease/exonuclease/phosphatase family protein [Phycisphaerales bacterium]|nr:endonuclease/exonuclease/phosphatase family protein [Phycisphaerales bacterium]
MNRLRTCGRIVKTVSRLTVSLGVLAIVVALIAGEGARFFGILDLLRHFQMQCFVFSMLGLVVLILVRAKRMAWVTVIVILLTGVRVMPWYFGRADVPDAGVARSMCLMHANVLFNNAQPAAMRDQIIEIDPDIIVLEEITGRWDASLAALKETWPHQYVVPRDDAFGLAVLSRFPIASAERVFHDAPLPSIDCLIRTPQGALRIVATHPVPPMSREAAEARDRQIDAVGDALDTARTRTMLVGDLNATMWSVPYEELRRETRFRNARQGFGVFPTWPASLPVLCRIPIDHVLVTPDIRVSGFRLGEPCGSDHLPVIVTFDIQATP